MPKVKLGFKKRKFIGPIQKNKRQGTPYFQLVRVAQNIKESHAARQIGRVFRQNLVRPFGRKLMTRQALAREEAARKAARERAVIYNREAMLASARRRDVAKYFKNK